MRAYDDNSVGASKCSGLDFWKLTPATLVMSDGTVLEGITYDPDGKIRYGGTWCLDARTGEGSDDPVGFMRCSDQDRDNEAQQFFVGAGSFKNYYKGHTKCLDNDRRLKSCDGDPESRRWGLKGMLEYMQYPGMCLDIPWADPFNGNELEMYPCHGGENQIWTYWIDEG
jgi:hypothetical protein